MVTAHPVPHPKENPGKGEMPGFGAVARGGRIVSGRPNHQNSSGD